MLPRVLALLQQALPDDCSVSGLCGMGKGEPPIPSGILFIAIGLVAAGIIGLRHRGRM